MNELSKIIQNIRPCDINSPYVFISYSSADRELVWRDVYEFQRRGYNIWLDEKNLDKTKESWKQDALTAIEDMECMLLVFYVSGTSLRSDACYRELSKTVADSTKAMHFGPVKFIAVDAEPVEDITVFTQKVFESIRNSNTDKEERRKQALALDGFMRQFFNSNNEKVRVHPKNEPNRKMDYYEEILSVFPDSTRIYPPESEAETEAGKPEAAEDAAETKKAVPAEDADKAKSEETSKVSTAQEEPKTVEDAAEAETQPVAKEPAGTEAAENTQDTSKTETAQNTEDASKTEEPQVAEDAAEAETQPDAKEPAGTETAENAEDTSKTEEPQVAEASDSTAGIKAPDFFSMPAEPEKDAVIYEKSTFRKKNLPAADCGSGIYRVPEGCTEIELLLRGNIFQRAEDMTVLELPDSIQKLNGEAFRGCKFLKTIRLPRYIDFLPFSSFEGCVSLTFAEIPGNVSKIASHAFKNCISLEKVKLPYHLSKLEMCVFEGCSSLSEIHLPPALQEVGINCFGKCSSLQEVHIPGSLKKLPNAMFEKCSSLCKVVIEDGVEEIGSSFSKCGEELHIWIPDTVQKISGIAFYDTNAVIHCSKDSAAYKYAVKNDMPVCC